MATATSQVKKLENYLEKVEREITELQYDFEDTQQIHGKLIELNDSSGRHNLWIEWIEETENETWKECKEMV